MKKVLHNVSIALGTLTSSLNEFSRVKGPDISPDGRLGGVGYIMALTDIKQTINSAVHNLGNIADCIADELTNPRWGASEDKEVKELIEDCANFQKENAADLEPYDSARAGHDFWLTRLRHGAGYWDGDYAEEVGKRLTDAAHAYGEVDLEVS